MIWEKLLEKKRIELCKSSEYLEGFAAVDISADMRAALNAVQQAAESILNKLKIQEGRVNFTNKDEKKGYVTEFDQLSESVIKQVLSNYANYSLLGEEGSSLTTSSEKTWIIDPIDGTTNFVMDMSFSAISVAMKHHDEFVLGIIRELHTGDIYFAEEGKGAYKNGKRITVVQHSDNPLVFINNGYSNASKENAGLQLAKLASIIGDFRKFGSTAYELACLAEGKAAAFIASGDEIWDYAAGLVIVKEAGGHVTDWRGDPFEFKSSYIIASNGDRSLHKKLVEASSDLQI